MDHGGIARSLLRRRADLEKNAFLGLAARGVARGARGAGNFVMRAAQNDPLSTALTVGGTAAFGPMLLQDSMKADPASQQRAMKRRALAQQIGTDPMKMKIGSVISREDVQRGLAIRRALEKTASKRDFAEELGELIFKQLGGEPVARRAGRGVSVPNASAGPKDSAIYGRRVLRRNQDKEIRKLQQQLKDQAEEFEKKREEAEKKRKRGKYEMMMSDPMKMFLGGAALSAGAMGVGAVGMGAANLLGKGTEFAYGARQKKHYGNMIKVDPSLKQEPRARAFFNVLHKASPFIATEPHVAAATVRSMIDAPEGYALHPKFMRDVLEIEEKRQKTRYPAMRTPTFKGDLPDLD